MKKIITLLTALACFFSLLILPAAAEESTDLLEQKLKERGTEPYRIPYPAKKKDVLEQSE